MKNHTWILLAVVFLAFSIACEKVLKDENLTLKKRPYIGNELRLDGFFYEEGVDDGYYIEGFFYQNGILLNSGGFYTENELNDLRNSIISGYFNSKVKENKYAWGLFVIDSNFIKFERYYNSDAVPKSSYIKYGKILNDSTFIMTKMTRSDGSESKTINETYHFKQFSPKPDSTNKFI